MLAAKNLSRESTDWLERAALVGTVTCMVHCLALPLLIAALPILSSALSVPESFHLWVLAFAIPAAAIALVQGRGRHGADFPVWLGGSGILLLLVGAVPLAETCAETPMTVVGSLVLAAAHITNWRLRHACSG